MYFPSDNTNTKFFLQLEGGYAEINNKEGTFFSGKVGTSVFFNQHVSFDIGAIYSRTLFNSYTTNSLGLELGLSIYLGKKEE